MGKISRVLLASSFLSFFIGRAYSADMPPDYSSWDHHRYSSSEKIFFENHPLLSNNSIREFFDKNTGDPKLLIWFAVERNSTVFHMHGDVKSYRVEKAAFRFYVRTEKKEWTLLQTREFIRAASTKNKRLYLFERDSPFGEEYFLFWESQGRKKDEITIPHIKFLSDHDSPD